MADETQNPVQEESPPAVISNDDLNAARIARASNFVCVSSVGDVGGHSEATHIPGFGGDRSDLIRRARETQ